MPKVRGSEWAQSLRKAGPSHSSWDVEWIWRSELQLQNLQVVHLFKYPEALTAEPSPTGP